MTLLHHIEEVFQMVVQYGVLLLECAGVTILLVTAVKSMIGCIKHNPHVRLNLAQGIALALEFKLGGEVLRTVIVREQSELLTLGAIILLRGALTFLIHWEIKTEEARMGESGVQTESEQTPDKVISAATVSDHINSHRQTWNTWKCCFQRVTESKWSGTKTAINNQKLSKKCLLTSLQMLVHFVVQPFLCPYPRLGSAETGMVAGLAG